MNSGKNVYYLYNKIGVTTFWNKNGKLIKLFWEKK